MTTDGLISDSVSEETIDSLLAVVEGIHAAALRTGDHSENVAAYAGAIARELSLEPNRLGRLRRTAILHDIGKSVVPAAILAKPGPLTPAERIVIERHSGAGAEMLRRAGLEHEAAMVRAHHERFDGAGYPDRLAGEAIPLEARIVFVADSFESMTSDRPYRSGMSVAGALTELRRCAGTQFDLSVVSAFEQVLADGRVTVRALRGGGILAAA
ncbi:MAG: HD domain-containing phosphohydrolase [Solirubrobacteraceae bacterium]